MKITITGHRPNKLIPLGYGYDLRGSKWQTLKKRIKDALLRYDCEELYDGMALGVDQITAIAVLELKDEGHDIKLHAIIPCANQEKMWPESSQMLYQAILSKADTITYVSKEEYTSWCMQKRNEYMVDNTDMVIAVWDGSAGGTKNCVDYALSKNMDVLQMKP